MLSFSNYKQNFATSTFIHIDYGKKFSENLFIWTECLSSGWLWMALSKHSHPLISTRLLRWSILKTKHNCFSAFNERTFSNMHLLKKMTLTFLKYLNLNLQNIETSKNKFYDQLKIIKNKLFHIHQTWQLLYLYTIIPPFS